MKKLLVSFAILIANIILDSSGNLVFAQEVSVKLFDATTTFDTGPITSPSEAIPFASASLILRFSLGDTAIISSTSDGLGSIAIDNFLTINGQNACEGVTGQDPPESCFGSFIGPNPSTGHSIENVFTLIPPIDVSEFIPVGTSAVLFELRDFGAIAGNTDLFLVTNATLISSTQPPVEQTLDTIRKTLQKVEDQIEQVAQETHVTRGQVRVIDQNVTAVRGRVVAIDQNAAVTKGRVEVIDKNVAAVRGRVVAIDQNAAVTKGRVEVIDKNVAAVRPRVVAIDQNVQKTEGLVRKVLAKVE